jgi:hypothetical protein
MDFSPQTESISSQTTYENDAAYTQHANVPHIDLSSARSMYNDKEAAAQYTFSSDGFPTDELKAAATNLGSGSEDKENDRLNQAFGSDAHVIDQKISHTSSQKKGKWKRVHKKEQEVEGMKTCDRVSETFVFGAHPSGTHTDRGPGALKRQDQDNCDNTRSSYMATPMDTTYYNKVSGASSVSVQGFSFLINEKQGNDKQMESSEGSFIKPSAPSLRPTEPSVVQTATAEQVCEGWRLRSGIQSHPASQIK